jgi:hypothetical protein
LTSSPGIAAGPAGEPTNVGVDGPRPQPLGGNRVGHAAAAARKSSPVAKAIPGRQPGRRITKNI